MEQKQAQEHGHRHYHKERVPYGQAHKNPKGSVNQSQPPETDDDWEELLKDIDETIKQNSYTVEERRRLEATRTYQKAVDIEIGAAALGIYPEDFERQIEESA